LTSPLDIGATGPAEMVAPCDVLAPTLVFFEALGFRVETIFPAEDPHTASLSGHGLRLRLQPGAGDPGTIRLGCERPIEPVTAPNGTRIEFVALDAPIECPPLRAEFVITRQADGPAQNVGRAGMIYRDLIPSRLGGRYIASHISIPDGGPVADWVHFHKIRFQMIFCRRGWARLVYEDQGEPFIMNAGDCVLQPSRIRHRVLETSPGFEVVEIGCPAMHETLADHGMALPTGLDLPDRDFSGQVFRHHVAAETPWTTDGDLERRDTGLARATYGLADAFVLRPSRGDSQELRVNRNDLLFGFMLDGSAVLGHLCGHPISPADAFVIPPGDDWALSGLSPDAEILMVTVAA
jgi:quercetin dioxygenase-like cupin family protein